MKKGSSEIEWYFWGSALESYLKSGLAFGILKLLAKKLTLINKLQGSDINLAKISAPSFRNLPPKLLVPSALDGFKSFKTFIFFQETSQKVWSLNNLNFTLVTLE